MSPSDEFKELLRSYGDMAYRMAYQLTGGRESEAADLVQELFIKIWRHWNGPRPTSMRGWMCRVLRNLYYDAARYRARHPSFSLSAPLESERTWEDVLPDLGATPDELAQSKDTQMHVKAALAQLADEYRTPVMLCDMEGLPYEDIARIMDCPIGTVRSRIHRGRMQLRSLLVRTHNTEVLP